MSKPEPMKKRTKKQRLRDKLTKQLLIVCVVATITSLVVLYGVIQAAKPTQPQRLVTFYDRGIAHSILTRAHTVRDALKSAAIEVDPHDITEPSLDSHITKSYVDIIIYRSRPVVVIDGSIRQTIMTPLQSPNEILKEAGLAALNHDDKTSFSRGNIVTDGAPTILTVSRSEVKVVQHVSFEPKPNALTKAKGAQVYVDADSVAHRETYYDLPMNIVIKSCGAANTYTIRSDGAKVDQDGYVLVAANLAAYPKCTVVDTSMGPGKVYDTGGFAARYPYGFDLATDWTNYDGL